MFATARSLSAPFIRRRVRIRPPELEVLALDRLPEWASPPQCRCFGAAIRPPAIGMKRDSGFSFGTSVKVEPLPVETAGRALG
jgi:hypothetical protein